MVVVNTHHIGVIVVSSRIVWMIPLVSILISILVFGMMVVIIAFVIVGVPMISPLIWVLVLFVVVIP